MRLTAVLLVVAQHLAAQPVAAPTKIVGAQGLWWILDDRGALRSFDGRRAIMQRLSGPVRDIARMSNDDLLALVERGRGFRVMEHVGDGSWTEFANAAAGTRESLIGLAAIDTNVVVVTGGALYSIRAGQTPVRRPIQKTIIPEGLQPALALTASGQLYVGKNAGEFGGGLIRIDVATGVGERVERRDNGCYGPLNSDCNPVTAVIPDPVDGRCAIASIGLIHMGMELGRVLRICGASVTVLAEIPCPRQPPRGQCSLGFFGLAADDSAGFWATSGSTLYHFRADTVDRQEPIPRLQRRSGFAFNDAIPGLLVLSTNINWRASVSGPTPLIGSR